MLSWRGRETARSFAKGSFMSGIHHVTAICGRAARNLDFYTRVLGMRLVKQTVNFDDPGTWHLYYGDDTGTPGTILTFFPWENAAAGRNGLSLTHETAFRIPAASIGYWTHRFVENGVSHEAPAKRYGDTVLTFTDPDGMRLALVGSKDGNAVAVSAISKIDPEHALRGFHGVTLLLEDTEPTAAVLTQVLGFRSAGSEGNHTRFVADAIHGRHVNIQTAKGFMPGRMGRGSVHHVAFRASSDEEQAEMARKLSRDLDIGTTEQKDRQYFRSVYFREPGGVIFEIATDDPGFAVDEPQADLGGTLKLPPFLEPRRQELVAALPPLKASR
jgi:glyoxalase family protein